MYYTIASLEDIAGNQTIDFIRDGRWYKVSLHNKRTNEIFSKVYDKIEKAEIVYFRLVRAIVEEERCNFQERKKVFNV